jgi:hypothetical protein
VHVDARKMLDGKTHLVDVSETERYPLIPPTPALPPPYVLPVTCGSDYDIYLGFVGVKSPV